MDLERQILSRFQRPAGPIPSSMLGLEAMTGKLDDFGFEDYLNDPRESETFRHVDTSCNGSSPWAVEGSSCPKLYVILVLSCRKKRISIFAVDLYFYVNVVLKL
ncbi:hypothetical protein C1H46_030512 [Malus baccata]|uniref:Uncharacterized protein n=1 Tax=Malus baccata TaxID=106549 RepID=A0A540LC40_MALBA|nr:hypothetical protein C1H46_030512 [Malus baccata]